MKTSEIKNRYLNYFEKNGHTLVPSASLISPDPSTLFTIAGMVPFIPYMIRSQEPPFPRATSCQKCVRTLDIDEVGKTTRHMTFFQMNGNFSFGDYFKSDAIKFAWELLTNPVDQGGYGLDKSKIWATVHETDDEAFELWQKIAGLPVERIQKRGNSDNFWSTGAPGPAGPCSEIYYDRGEKYGIGGGPIKNEERFLEVWNLVFMQFEVTNVRSKTDFDIVKPLQYKNIDTGMGLERLAALLQDKDNVYEIDEIFPVIQKTEELTKQKYGIDETKDIRFRIIADHIRSSLMIINDGVVPSNEGRGYVLRRLLRRSINALRLLGYQDLAFGELFQVSNDCMKLSYPELESNWEKNLKIILQEEKSFHNTLTTGLSYFDSVVQDAQENQQKKLNSADVFRLHDTHGFPFDLTLEMAREKGLEIDEQGFKNLMNEQKERARQDAKSKRKQKDQAVYQEIKKSIEKESEFTDWI